jgi:alpha-methylacyl-CoA racemase
LEDEFVAKQYDVQTWPRLRARLAEIFRSRTRDAWCALLEGSDACFAPVLSMQEAPRHPHNVSRGVFVEIDGYPQPAPAPRFSRTPAAVPKPPPAIGAHTDDVLREAGFGAAEIKALRKAGAIR